MVDMVTNLRRLPADAPLSARARAEQAVASMFSRWGLDPAGDANLGPIQPPEPAVLKFYRLADGTIGPDSDPVVRAAIRSGKAQLLGHVSDPRAN